MLPEEIKQKINKLDLAQRIILVEYIEDKDIIIIHSVFDNIQDPKKYPLGDLIHV